MLRRLICPSAPSACAKTFFPSQKGTSPQTLDPEDRKIKFLLAFLPSPFFPQQNACLPISSRRGTVVRRGRLNAPLRELFLAPSGSQQAKKGQAGRRAARRADQYRRDISVPLSPLSSLAKRRSMPNRHFVGVDCAWSAIIELCWG